MNSECADRLSDVQELLGATFEDEITERNIAFETEYQLEEFRKIQSEYFDEDDKCYTGIRLSENIMERMLKLINQLYKELTTN